MWRRPGLTSPRGDGARRSKFEQRCWHPGYRRPGYSEASPAFWTKSEAEVYDVNRPLLAALMWVYAEEVGPSMHAFNGSFGVGMLLAPLIVSWDLAENDDFHNACE